MGERGIFGKIKDLVAERQDKAKKRGNLRAMHTAHRSANLTLPSESLQRHADLQIPRRLLKISNTHPEIAYYVYGQLAAFYIRCEFYVSALEAAEQSVLLHPDPESGKLHFKTLADNYVSALRFTIQQYGIANLKNRETQDEALEALQISIDSSKRVLVAYPDLKTVIHEHITAQEWLNRTRQKRFPVSSDLFPRTLPRRW